MTQLRVTGFLAVFVVTALAGGAVGVLALAIQVGSLAVAGTAVIGLLVLVMLVVVGSGRLGAPMRDATTYW